MKKKLIAASAASLAVAAMPVVGVFAAGSGTPVTTTSDTLTLTVPDGCMLTVPSGRDTAAEFGSVGVNQTATETTGSFSIGCNAKWKLTVAGDTLSGTSGNAQTESATIKSTSGAIDATISNFKLSLNVSNPGTATVSNSYESLAAIPASAGNALTSDDSVTAVTVTPTYKVAVGPGQASGNYSGTVTYTVGLNPGA